MTEVLPVLYLRGISSKDFVPALAEFFGSEAGLSASTIQRLTLEWTQELKEFEQHDLSQVDCVVELEAGALAARSASLGAGRPPGRDPSGPPSEIEPDLSYEYRIDLGMAAHTLAAGHRVRSRSQAANSCSGIATSKPADRPGTVVMLSRLSDGG